MARYRPPSPQLVKRLDLQCIPRVRSSGLLPPPAMHCCQSVRHLPAACSLCSTRRERPRTDRVSVAALSQDTQHMNNAIPRVAARLSEAEPGAAHLLNAAAGEAEALTHTGSTDPDVLHLLAHCDTNVIRPNSKPDFQFGSTLTLRLPYMYTPSRQHRTPSHRGRTGSSSTLYPAYHRSLFVYHDLLILVIHSLRQV